MKQDDQSLSKQVISAGAQQLKDLQEVRAVPVHRMPVVGSRQVQVCKHQRDEAERKRCESHNPSGARPAPVPSASPSLSQVTRRSQHPSSPKRLFKFPVAFTAA